MGGKEVLHIDSHEISRNIGARLVVWRTGRTGTRM